MIALPPDLAALLEGAGAPMPPAPRLAAPDIQPWLAGNVLPGVWSFAADAPGPHLVIVGCVHGNEIAGAVLLDRLLRARVCPRRGRLTLCFANLDALCRFDPDDPTASRFLEEDLNRVWDRDVLDGPRRSSELRRARALRPVLDAADVVLDLHSMLWPSDPLFLVGGDAASARLALAIGEPPLVVADGGGHESGRRLIDYRPDWRGVLLEGGWHWEPETTERMGRAAHRLMRLLGPGPGPDSGSESGSASGPASGSASGSASGPESGPGPGPGPGTLAPGPTPRFARVTRTVTARSDAFAFTRPWRGGEVVGQAGTLLALDGEQGEVRAPHDGCLLVMPSLLALPGHTAVRLARFEAPP